MKKEIKCKECNHIWANNYYCDNCTKDLLLNFRGIPITIDFGYPHNLDGSEYHFCNYKCLKEFIDKEINKEN